MGAPIKIGISQGSTGEHGNRGDTSDKGHGMPCPNSFPILTFTAKWRIVKGWAIKRGIGIKIREMPKQVRHDEI